MILFESMLTLLLVAIVLLQFSRKWLIPYPAMLAVAGVIVAALPWAPDIEIDPQLALALFITPALLVSAYGMPLRDFRRHWIPLVSLAAIAVLLTTVAVAWASVVIAGMPLAAAIALGAIVAPPDAVAAAAMLGRFKLPRDLITILKGESLLNDAVALIIFGASVGMVTHQATFFQMVPGLALAIPGGLLLGIALGWLCSLLVARLAGTLSGTLFEFVSTFGAWVIAQQLEFSAILCVVAFAMTLARYHPERQTARERVHSRSVWETTVFMLNVFAFLLMGLQARGVINRLNSEELVHALGFAVMVLGIVVFVRMIWTMLYNRINHYGYRLFGKQYYAHFTASFVVGWCGMRGLVTLATALALPDFFPARDLIILSAFTVVLGTLIIQGLTLGLLLRWVPFPKDDSYRDELYAARVTLLNTAINHLQSKVYKKDEIASILQQEYIAETMLTHDGQHPRAVTKIDELRRQSIANRRKKLAAMRRNGFIEEDVFHALEEELDWAELAATPPREILEA